MIDPVDTPLNSLPSLNYTSTEESTVINDAENQRFTKHSALLTLLIMSIGPLSLLMQAIGEAIDMLLITKRFKDTPDSHAVEIIGFTGQIIGFSLYVGLFFGQAIGARVSSLIGSGDRSSASHLVSNAILLCFIVSIIFAIIFIFLFKPLLQFLGTPDYMIKSTIKFLLPIYSAIPITSLVYIAQYYLQSIGNSILSGLIKVSVYVLQLCVFSPLFLFGFKVSTTFMKLGNVISNIIVAICMMILMYRGKFSLKLSIKDVFAKFHPEIKKAILSALPLLLSYLVYSLPQILILQTLTSAAKDYAKEIGGVFAVYTRMIAIVVEFPGAFTQSFLSTGTHAWGSQNPKRLIKLTLWTILLSTLCTFIISASIILNKSAICKAFLNNDDEIKLAEKMIPIPFYTVTLQGISTPIALLMIIIGKPILAFISSLVQMGILCGGCKLIANWNKDDVTRIMYVYNISDVLYLTLNLILLTFPIIAIKKKLKELNSMTINEKLLYSAKEIN